MDNKNEEHDLEEEFEEKLVKDRVTRKILQWVRVIVPLILAAIGWYVSAVISPMDKRITTLETKCDIVRQHIAGDAEMFKHIEETMEDMEDDHRRYIDINTKHIDELQRRLWINAK